MLKESALFTMLLIAASIVVTVSVYEPAKVGTQPPIQQPAQIQPQPQQQPQTQKQPLQGSQILGQVKPPTGTGIVTKELQENAQLADRLFPFIVQKLDGNTLVQKLDVNTVSYLTDKMNGQKLAALILQKIHENQLRELVQKMDGQLLAEKVYPHLGLKAALTARPGQNSVMKASGPSPPTQLLT